MIVAFYCKKSVFYIKSACSPLNTCASSSYFDSKLLLVATQQQHAVPLFSSGLFAPAISLVPCVYWRRLWAARALVVRIGVGRGVYRPKIAAFTAFALFAPFTSACTCLPMTKSKNTATAATAPVSYEAALEELELLIGRVESGQLPLEEMQAAYQRGEMLMAFCRQRLDTVQDQMQVLDDGALKPLAL